MIYVKTELKAILKINLSVFIDFFYLKEVNNIFVL